MTKLGGLLRLSVFVSWSLLATAADAAGETKFEAAFRTGYGIPLGKATSDARLDMSEATAGQLPLWLEAGARIRERVFLGAYVSYGFGFLGSTYSQQCKDAATAAEVRVELTCSSSDTRFGALGLYHFGQPTEIHAWLGGGIGYEWWTLNQSVSNGTQSADLGTTAHGFEVLSLHLGGDFPIAKGFVLAPFVTITLAQFGRASGSCSGDCEGITTRSTSITEKSFHEWLFFGVRAAVLP